MLNLLLEKSVVLDFCLSYNITARKNWVELFMLEESGWEWVGGSLCVVYVAAPHQYACHHDSGIHIFEKRK